MDIAVISDIHGNHAALKKCMEYAIQQKIKTFLFLGDYLGELAYPQKTMQLLYSIADQYDCCFVRGNKENYWLNYADSGEQGWRDKDSTTGSLLYTYHNLEKKDLDFFRGMKISDTLHFQDLPPVTVCHGSPERADEKMLENESTYKQMDSGITDLILCGHTHLQGTILHNGKMAVNPGSAGVSLHSNGRAQFMILHGNQKRWEIEFVNVEYDVEKVIQEIKESGLESAAPYWCQVTEHLLRTGEISHGTVLGRAMRSCSDEMGDCKWPDVPEKYWKLAVNECLKKVDTQDR